jgi:hypothetical protein
VTWGGNLSLNFFSVKGFFRPKNRQTQDWESLPFVASVDQTDGRKLIRYQMEKSVVRRQIAAVAGDFKLMICGGDWFSIYEKKKIYSQKLC